MKWKAVAGMIGSILMVIGAWSTDHVAESSDLPTLQAYIELLHPKHFLPLLGLIGPVFGGYFSGKHQRNDPSGH